MNNELKQIEKDFKLICEYKLGYRPRKNIAKARKFLQTFIDIWGVERATLIMFEYFTSERAKEWKEKKGYPLEAIITMAEELMSDMEYDRGQTEYHDYVNQWRKVIEARLKQF